LAERIEKLDGRVAAGLARRQAARTARRMRHLLAALAASLLALVVVGGLAAFAVENARQARVSAAAARKQSLLALGTLNAVIFDIQRALVNLPGTSSIRARLLGTALKQLERLSGEYVEQSLVDRETAAALNETGDLILQLGIAPGEVSAQGGQELSHLETNSAAESARNLYSRSLEILQILAKDHPKDAEIQRDLSASFGRLGDAHRQLGAIDKALEAYEKALVLCEAAAEANINDARAKRDLSVSYNKLGDVYLLRAAREKALELYEKGFELRDALARANPNDSQAKRDLSISYNKLGDVQLKLGARTKALDLYKKYLDLNKSLANARSKDAWAPRDLTFSYQGLGDVHVWIGEKNVSAPRSEGKGLTPDQALAEADLGDAQAMRDLSISYNKIGDVQLELREYELAYQFYRTSLLLREALAKADPGDARARRDLAFTYEKVGDVQFELRTSNVAAASYRMSRDLRESLAKADPKETRATRDLAISNIKLGDANLQRMATDEALESYRKALELSEKLAQADRSNVEAKQDLSRSYFGIGQALEQIDTFHAPADVQKRAGQIKEARRSYEEGIKLDPNSISLLHALASLLATCWDDSVRDGQSAIEPATRACKLTEWKKPLYLDTLSAAYAEAGRFEDAVKWQKKALELAEGFPSEIESRKKRLKLYESGKPFHQTKSEPAPSADVPPPPPLPRLPNCTSTPPLTTPANPGQPQILSPCRVVVVRDRRVR
jgi:tetratricopeptide (TPR) repeat protein